MIDLPARYRAISELAGGGMSDTWLCHDNNLNRKVVVKAVKFGIAKSKLLDELGALSSIRSKHVVQVLDVIHDAKGEIYAFVEEYIEGPGLTCAAVANPTDALKKLYPIACGICEIHEHKLLHRDLKPDNMKFDAEGTLKIFDFGLAKMEQSDGTSVLYFSAGYTAPEAFAKNAKGFHEYSRAVDVFAFGATALWLLNQGKLPPEFSTMPPTIPAGGCDFGTLPCGLPAPVSAILNACLVAPPAGRPSMDDVRSILKRYLLKDRHRMLLTYGAQDYWLDANNRTTNLSLSTTVITITYDGLDFRVTAVTGHVEINNIVTTVGTVLTGAAVIVLNSGTSRVSITADVSHPEVMQ